MRNKLVLLLGMVIIFLSFFAFQGGQVLTGFVVKERQQITSRFIEEPSFVLSDNNEITRLYTDKSTVKRGDELILVVDPGKSGVYTRGEIRDGKGRFVRYFYICGLSFTNDKRCSSPRHLPLSLSRSASSPSNNPYTLSVVDGFGPEVTLDISVK